jgi:hypothetical protein
MAVLLIDVLTGLGGASQEKSAARNFFGSTNEKARTTVMSAALFRLKQEFEPQTHKDKFSSSAFV